MRVVYFLWSLPIKIMKSGVSLLNSESTVAQGKNPRRRPLHTCGAQCLAVAHKACKKLQDFDGPLGSMTKRAIVLFNLFSPFIYAMLYKWLAVLSLMDDHFLTIENMVETIFPPSKHVFDKIDGLVCSAENLPEHIDDFLRKFPLMIHQFPILDWILAHLISWLNCLLSALSYWGSKNNPREKEITIDIVNCKSDQESEEKSCCPVETLATGQSDSLEGKEINGATRVHSPNIVQFAEVEKSYSSPQRSNELTTKNHHYHHHHHIIEPSSNGEKVLPNSVKRLHSFKNRIKALDDPNSALDSPIYSSYQSANSSPVSDSENQMSTSDTMNCTYKEMLERGKKEKEEEDEDGKLDDDVLNSEIAQTDGKYLKQEQSKF